MIKPFVKLMVVCTFLYVIGVSVWVWLEVDATNAQWESFVENTQGAGDGT